MKSYTIVVQKNTNTMAGTNRVRSGTEPNTMPAVMQANCIWYSMKTMVGICGAILANDRDPSLQSTIFFPLHNYCTKERPHGEQEVANGVYFPRSTTAEAKLRQAPENGPRRFPGVWSGTCGFDPQSCHFFLSFLNFLQQPFNGECFFGYFVDEGLWDLN